MGVPNQFNDIIQKNLNVFAAWIPIVNKYKLGDYGVFANGIFSKLGNITDDFQVTFIEGSGSEASIDFTSEGARVTKLGGDANVPTGSPVNVKAAIEVEFSKEQSFLVKSPTITVSTIDNVNEVSKKLNETGKWDGQWKVVYQVYNALDAVIVSTIEAGTKLDFNGDATALEQMNLGHAGVNIDTNKTLGLNITGKSGIIGLGLFRIKSKLFGGKKVVVLSDDLPVGDEKPFIKLNASEPVKDDL